MYYVRYPLSFRQVEDILHERGIDICHENLRPWSFKCSASLPTNKTVPLSCVKDVVF